MATRTTSESICLHISTSLHTLCQTGTYSLGLSPFGSINLELNVGTRGVTADNLGVELELDTLLLQSLLGSLGNLRVHTGTTNLAQELNDGNLGAKTGPDGSHLKTNDTTTNYGQSLRDLLQRESSSAGNDALLVDLEAREGSSLRTSSDEDVLATEGGLATVVEGDLDLVLADKGTSSLDVLGAVLLEQELNALGQTGDSGVLGLHEVGQVELDIADLDTSVFRVVKDLVVQVGVVEE